MNCPNCQKELPENSTAVVCPHCGDNLSAGATSTPSVSSLLPPVPVNWFVFFSLLLAPGVVALLGSLAKLDGLSVASPLLGGPVAGIICGILLARRIGRTPQSRIGLGILFAALLGFLSFALGFGGCMVGGFKMNFH